MAENVFGVTTADGGATSIDSADLTEKVTPIAADRIRVEDSAAGFAPVFVELGNIPGAGASTLTEVLTQGNASGAFDIVMDAGQAIRGTDNTIGDILQLIGGNATGADQDGGGVLIQTGAPLGSGSGGQITVDLNVQAFDVSNFVISTEGTKLMEFGFFTAPVNGAPVGFLLHSDAIGADAMFGFADDTAGTDGTNLTIGAQSSTAGGVGASGGVLNLRGGVGSGTLGLGGGLNVFGGDAPVLAPGAVLVRGGAATAGTADGAGVTVAGGTSFGGAQGAVTIQGYTFAGDAASFTMPTTQGAAGSVITDVAGDGVLSFQTAGTLTLQGAYDGGQTINPTVALGPVILDTLAEVVSPIDVRINSVSNFLMASDGKVMIGSSATITAPAATLHVLDEVASGNPAVGLTIENTDALGDARLMFRQGNDDNNRFTMGIDESDGFFKMANRHNFNSDIVFEVSDGNRMDLQDGLQVFGGQGANLLFQCEPNATLVFSPTPGEEFQINMGGDGPNMTFTGASGTGNGSDFTAIGGDASSATSVAGSINLTAGSSTGGAAGSQAGHVILTAGSSTGSPVGDVRLNVIDGQVELQANGTTHLAVTAAGAVDVDPLSGEDFTITTAGGGNAVVNAYTFPDLLSDTFIFTDTDGSAGQFLGTDGAGNLTFSTPPSAAVDSVASGNSDIITVSPTTGNVVVTAANQEIDIAGDNTFYGEAAGNVGTHSGIENTGFGTNALASLTTGSRNIAVGFNALPAMATGSDNIGIGEAAASLLSSGLGNIVIGGSTAAALTTESNNTIVGNATAFQITSGNNVIVGRGSMAAATTGGGHTIIGASAGATITTGSDNTIIGALADAPAAGISSYLNIHTLIYGSTDTNRRVQIGGGATAQTPSGDASLRLSEVDSAFVTNVLTTAERDAMTAEDGMFIYNTTVSAFQFRESGAWGGLGGTWAQALSSGAVSEGTNPQISSGDDIQYLGDVNHTLGYAAASAAAGGTLTIAAQAAGGTDENGGSILLTPGAATGSGLDGVVTAGAYTFPAVSVDTFLFTNFDGSAGQFLQTDGAGNITFQSIPIDSLQDAYEVDPVIDISVLFGQLQFNNSTDATDTLQLERLPGAATGGNALSVNMGVNATGRALSVDIDASSAADGIIVTSAASATGDLLRVTPSTGNAVQVTAAGVINLTSTGDTTIAPSTASTISIGGANASLVDIRPLAAGADIVIRAQGAGGDVTVRADSGLLTIDSSGGELQFDDTGNSGLTLSQSAERTLARTAAGEIQEGTTSIVGAVNKLSRAGAPMIFDFTAGEQINTVVTVIEAARITLPAEDQDFLLEWSAAVGGTSSTAEHIVTMRNTDTAAIIGVPYRVEFDDAANQEPMPMARFVFSHTAAAGAIDIILEFAATSGTMRMTQTMLSAKRIYQDA